MSQADPVAALVLIDRVPVTFKGTPVGTSANELLTELKKDKAVQTELKARPTLDAIRKLDSHLTQLAEKYGIETKDPMFLKANTASIDQLKRSLQLMNKTYPDTRATQQAAAIGEKYGVSVR